MNEYTNDGRGLDMNIHVSYDTKQITLMRSLITWKDDGKNLKMCIQCNQSSLNKWTPPMKANLGE